MAKTAPAIIFFNDYSVWSALEMASMKGESTPIALLTTFLESAIKGSNGVDFKSKNKMHLYIACKKEADKLGIEVAQYIEVVARVNLIKESENLVPKESSNLQKSIIKRLSEWADLNRDARKASAPEMA